MHIRKIERYRESEVNTSGMVHSGRYGGQTGNWGRNYMLRGNVIFTPSVSAKALKAKKTTTRTRKKT